jgi:hypothetical protein
MITEINDRMEYLNMYQSQCATCRHFDWDTCTCKAFPEEIPDALLAGDKKHDSVIKGQTGNTTYEQEDE